MCSCLDVSPKISQHDKQYCHSHNSTSNFLSMHSNSAVSSRLYKQKKTINLNRIKGHNAEGYGAQFSVCVWLMQSKSLGEIL